MRVGDCLLQRDYYVMLQLNIIYFVVTSTRCEGPRVRAHFMRVRARLAKASARACVGVRWRAPALAKFHLSVAWNIFSSVRIVCGAQAGTIAKSPRSFNRRLEIMAAL